MTCSQSNHLMHVSQWCFELSLWLANHLFGNLAKYISCQASRITAKLASWGKLRFNQDEKLVFVNYLIKKFTEDKSEWLIASTSSLLIILRVVENRKISIEMGIDKMLVNLLGRSGKSFQLQYQVSWIELPNRCKLHNDICISFNDGRLDCLLLVANQFQSFCGIEKKQCGLGCMRYFKRVWKG